MKLAFDEHVPPVLVGVFKYLAGKSRVTASEICSAADYCRDDRPGAGDEPWLRRFAGDGGRIVVSGDYHMRSRHAERQAMKDAGFVVFFYAKRWNNENFFNRLALTVRWWPEIEKVLQESSPGDFWEIPFQWSTTSGLKDVTGPRSIGE